ncbi:hypothetical protein [Sulfitobacter geojensis]|uniref:hypothetical protein n=1 Tax=Sulfitobacter geojensis TaxID=1342299 RepID=UPI000469EB8A|nr:hypothetical protein [Sulfitobacter geojensis]
MKGINPFSDGPFILYLHSQRIRILVESLVQVSTFIVPQLLAKLKLLNSYGRFENLADIAGEFDISEDAVRFWSKETAGQDAGTIPPKRIDKLLSLFAETLPNQSNSDIEVLLKGPLADLEDAMRLGEHRALRKTLCGRTDMKSGRLIPVNIFGLGLVVANRPSRKAHCKFPLGQSFRLEFTSQHQGRYLLGIQKSPQGWGCIEADWSADRGLIHMPGMTEAGDFGSLDESSDDGVSQFFAFQSTRQFPSVFAKSLMDEVPLSRSEISLLAQFVQETPETDVHVMRFDVEFINPVSV